MTYFQKFLDIDQKLADFTRFWKNLKKKIISAKMENLGRSCRKTGFFFFFFRGPIICLIVKSLTNFYEIIYCLSYG